MNFFKTTSVIAMATILFSFAGCAQASESSTTLSKSEIEKLVKAYLLENPEIIRDALIVLEDREDRESIQAVADELRNDKRDYSIGPKNAKVTIVEFFDYNCSFCKQSTAWVREVMVKHPKDVRVIFKELPILERRTRTSRNAAKAALAAHKQGKYSEMHFALMAASDVSQKFITSTAVKLGMNMKKFEKDMASEDLDSQLEDTMYLASLIPSLTGTPFFVINDQFLASGDAVKLQSMLNEELSN